MFSQMISALQEGTLPENNSLRKRFDAALVKKAGVIRTPSSFWSTDTKINPPARQLLWAAILLRDRENARLIEAIITTEIEEKQRTKGLPLTHEELITEVRRRLQDYIREFIDMAPNEAFRKILKLKTEEIFSKPLQF